MKKRVSIIIRTKNEERWISHCLGAVMAQDFTDFDVIIVDNESTDQTIKKAKQFNVAKIITCRDYMPGKALNMGIDASRGDFITCLSGHCIPVNERWLSNLLRGFNSDPDVAGVYGRQEPLAFTSDSDKRDLTLVFGLDRRVQVKDSFFHNANSMIRRDVWRDLPFDSKLTNIEDRAWAREVLREGYKIVYEPEASVYHHHGIHQNGDEQRCANVVRILERMHGEGRYTSIGVGKMNIVAIIPVKGPMQQLAGKPLLSYTLERAAESRYIKKVVVSTNDIRTAQFAKRYKKVEIPFMRDELLSRDYIDLDRVLQFSLDKIEESGIFPDLIVPLEVTFPFRPNGLIDDMIMQLVSKGLDSVIAAKSENKAIWQEKEGKVVQLEEGLTPRQFKDRDFIELRGVGCVTHPEFIREASTLGNKIGIYEVSNPYSYIEVRSKEDFEMASALAKRWFK